MIPHHDSLSEILKQLGVDPEAGLSAEEATLRLESHGENRLREEKKKGNFRRFLEQFKDIMIIILMVAAVVSFAVSFYEGEGFIEPVLIILIVVLNAIIGVVQESKAEKALEALKRLSVPHARVLRDGEESIIESTGLVPGDIVLVEAGDFVPADCRIVSCASLKVEESALTGESVPSEKNAETTVSRDAPLGDRHNMIFSGCGVSYGRTKALVTATGMDTEMGKIAGLLAGEKEGSTPLQRKLATLGKYLGTAALLVCAVIFIIGLIDGIPLMEIFMISVSLAVSAIPEGLPAIVTIVLAIGVQRMVKRNAIIRKLPAVETLGSASVICSDKTGTLTQNRMTLVKAFDGSTSILEDIGSDNSPSIKKLLRYAALCCDGRVVFEDGMEKHIGDPTETAIILAAHKNGMMKEELDTGNLRLAEIPFDSERKMMTTVNLIDGKKIVIVKGAFDVLSDRCVEGNMREAREYIDQMGRDALRVLAVAFKEIDSVPAEPAPEILESNLTFMGLVGMIDPARPEAKEAVVLCRKAGIKPVMITGDHSLTASAIARELGILGDGVNDAPALKAADIGCAMGITGTDVAKGAADMTLTDDNFATIVEAVREGRGIYDNIRKVVGFLLGTNIGEILTVFFAMLLWRESPLLSMQLLWINLVTDSLPAIALGMEPVENDVMNRKPRRKGESIFANGLGLQVLLQGMLFSALTLTGFIIGRMVGDIATGRTMAFLVLSLTQVIHSFNMRSSRSLFKIGPFTNRTLTLAAAVSFAMIALVSFVPTLATVFGLKILGNGLYLIAILLAFVPLPVLELTKIIGLARNGKYTRN